MAVSLSSFLPFVPFFHAFLSISWTAPVIFEWILVLFVVLLYYLGREKGEGGIYIQSAARRKSVDKLEQGSY